MSTFTTTVTEAVKPRKQGLLFVGARFTSFDLPYPDYARWYDEIHIPHLISMKGCRAAMRYARITEPSVDGRDTKQSTLMPYATLYPIHDVDWVYSEEFDTAKDSTDADYLPGRSAFKSVEFEGRTYEFIGGSPLMGGGEGKEAAKFAVVTNYKSKSAEGEYIEKFFGTMSALPGCRGTTRYVYCEVQRPDFTEKFAASGQWPARNCVIHGFDVEKAELESVYRARDEIASQLSDPSTLDVAIYELVFGMGG
ncbi:hypothetical protein DM02DRAFT_656079 [Periconia macrospinosa]|uniref:EthD domain-containing protein n=1 Tax=Periconia macrospinosa TaxID=97972 RepID=A0A2V1DNT1_9PLEO|nr:hypothetical protein DM02DRAFT_656079 [Periconia macrospinosa]